MLSDRVWTLDVGNSRGKLRDWRTRGGIWLCGAAEWSLDVLLEGLREKIASDPESVATTCCAISCVAAEQLEKRLCDLLLEAFGPRFLGAPESGLENLCDPPQGVGRDRLFAARGAFERVGSSALVIDVGTAMTVDALIVSDRPQFAGGAIAPGPALLAAALHSATARLPLVEDRSVCRALGRDTVAAIASGIRHGLRGAARELVDRISEETSLEEAPVFLTGGAASWLGAPHLFPGRAVHADSELVQVGLLCAALDRLDLANEARRYDVPTR